MSGTLQVGGVTLGTHNSGTGKVDITNAGATTVTTLNTTSIASGAIGSNVTIADGANPHGWEHIKTISYSADASGAQKMSNVVTSAYSAYKLFVQWGPNNDNHDLFFRFTDDSDAEISNSSYSYACHVVTESAQEGNHFSSTANSAVQISNDSVRGSRGFNGEITLFNCVKSSTDFPQIDGYQLDTTPAINSNPHAYFQYTGHDSGNYDLGGYGFFWYDVNPQYVSGFQLTWAANTPVQKGSWWSCYGLKLPTAD